MPEPEPTPEPEPEPTPEREWSERGESTQVLPSSWEPPPPPARESSGELAPVTGTIRTTLAEGRAEAEPDEEAEASPSTAEQAVPWLIGVILLLAGMVIVLLALIFAGDASLGGAGVNASESAPAVLPSGSPGDGVAVTRTPRPASSPPAATAAPTPTPIALPQYGPLEMVYQGRSAALAPIYLLRRDFTTNEDQQEVLARDPALDVRRFAWAPDGTAGAALLADVLVSIELGEQKRPLGDGLDTVTFGDDAETVYAVRVTPDDDDDVATVLAIDFASGESEELASISYARPSIEERPDLADAQLADDGGAVRLYWMVDDTLRLWSLGAGSWEIDPSDGTVTELDTESPPTLWGPNGDRRVALELEGDTTNLRLVDARDRVLASTSQDGRVSHLRWSPDGERIVFTLGRSAAGGGILQDLFLWDLSDDEGPVQLTSTGAAFGAEWRGTQPRWQD